MRGFAKIFLVVLLIGILAVAFLWERRTSAVEQILTEQLGVEVTIDDISMGFSGVTVSGLHIGVLEGSKLDYSFEADSIAVTCTLGSLFGGEMIEIDDITVDPTRVGVELYSAGGKDNNWTRIANNIPKPEEGEEEGKKVLVKRLALQNMEITVVGKGIGSDPMVVRPDKPLILTDVGGGKPLPTAEITRMIIAAMMKHMTGVQALKGITEGLINVPGDVIKGVLPGNDGGGVLEKPKEIFKGIFGK